MIEPKNETPPVLDPRVGLAAERTLLAWVRTGLALMGFGFVVARFGFFLHEIAATGHAPPITVSGLSLWIGGGLVVLGVVVNVIAAVQHIRLLRQLERGAVSASRAPKTGKSHYPGLELVLSRFRAAFIHRRTWMTAESVIELRENRDKIVGLRITYEPRHMRFFQARFEPVEGRKVIRD